MNRWCYLGCLIGQLFTSVAVAEMQSVNVLSPYRDTVEVFLTKTPSNILVANENPVRINNILTKTEAHLTLTGVSKTSPSFKITARADFMNNSWTISDVQVVGTIPTDYDKPELQTEDVVLLQGEVPTHFVLVMINNGPNYAMTWRIMGKATEYVRPVLIPRFMSRPWVGLKRGWVLKVRDDYPSGGFDPYSPPYGVENANLKNLIDPAITSAQKQSNDQVVMRYDVKEVYYGGPVADIQCAFVEQNVLAQMGIDGTNYYDNMDWTSLTMYSSLQSKVQAVPQGCAPYSRGNWYPNILYPFGQVDPKTFFHEFNHTHHFGGHPRTLWSCDTKVSADGYISIDPTACKQSSNVVPESMGSMSTLWLHPIHRAAVGWLKGAQVKLISKTGVYNLYSDNSDFTSNPTRPLLLQIPATLNDIDDFFYVTLTNTTAIRDDPNLTYDTTGLIEYLSSGLELSTSDKTFITGKSRVAWSWYAFSYNNTGNATEEIYKRTISPGNEMQLLTNNTDIRIKNLDRLGNQALVSVRFNNEPLPASSGSPLPVILAPSNLVALRLEYKNTTKLAWNDNSAVESGYIIERSIGNQTSFQELARVGANLTTFMDAYSSTGTPYYRIRAENSEGFSSYSNIASYQIAQSS